MRALIWAIGGTAALAIASISNGQVAPGVKPIQPTPRFTPKVTPTLKPQGCNVDPAIVSVTLTRMPKAHRTVKFSYVVVNRGSAAWRSGPSQQNVTLTARNANTNTTFTDTKPLPGSAAPGARMATITTAFVPNAFDDFEFAGSLDIRIGYDPDIAIDANICNDDANSANNAIHLDNGQLLGFLKGKVDSKTWTF